MSVVFEKHIHDSVHGYIGITAVEREIIDTPVFQRLRHIRHLGLADFVYPAASHTRFSHSLGSMFVMDRLATQLISNGKIESNVLQKLRLAALLHDLGHYPFSHVVEGVMKDLYGKADGRHESLTEKVVQKTQVQEILRSNGQDPDEIVSIVRGNHKNKLYNFLLSSDFDVDRIDYLLRDALHTGVAYGYVDVNRLVRTVTVDPEGARLAVLEKGRQAMENFLIGRYHMYQTVYYHKTVAAFELMLKTIYSQLVSSSIMPDLNAVFASEDQFCKFDDHYVWTKMAEHAGTNNYLKELITMLRTRQPIKVVFEETSLTPDEDTVKKQSRLRLVQFPLQHDLLSKTSGVESEWIFFLEPPSIHLMASQEDDTAIMVQKEDKCVQLVEDNTSIVNLLGKSTFLSPRVYTRNDEYRDKVRKGITACFGI